MQPLADSPPESHPQRFALAMQVHAAPDRVWAVLTDPAAIATWMGGDEFALQVQLEPWEGGDIRMQGHHIVDFKSRGKVMRFEPPAVFRYSHLSSLSRLPDVAESYCIFTFTLQADDAGTLLSLAVENFPTATIYFHLEFFWRTASLRLKAACEQVSI